MGREERFLEEEGREKGNWGSKERNATIGGAELCKSGMDWEDIRLLRRCDWTMKTGT